MKKVKLKNSVWGPAVVDVSQTVTDTLASQTSEIATGVAEDEMEIDG